MQAPPEHVYKRSAYQRQAPDSANRMWQCNAASLAAALMTYQYALPGFYQAKATVTLDDGNPNTALEQVIVQTPVLVQNLTLTRLTLCQVFGQMKQRLAAVDIEGALQALHPAIRADYQPRWTNLGVTLFNNTARLGRIADGRIGTRTAEYLVLSPGAQPADPPRGYRIQYELGADGVWRISAL